MECCWSIIAIDAWVTALVTDYLSSVKSQDPLPKPYASYTIAEPKAIDVT